jgi:hypothetical protein
LIGQPNGVDLERTIEVDIQFIRLSVEAQTIGNLSGHIALFGV